MTIIENKENSWEDIRKEEIRIHIRVSMHARPTVKAAAKKAPLAKAKKKRLKK